MKLTIIAEESGVQVRRVLSVDFDRLDEAQPAAVAELILETLRDCEEGVRTVKRLFGEAQTL